MIRKCYSSRVCFGLSELPLVESNVDRLSKQHFLETAVNHVVVRLIRSFW